MIQRDSSGWWRAKECFQALASSMGQTGSLDRLHSLRRCSEMSRRSSKTWLVISFSSYQWSMKRTSGHVWRLSSLQESSRLAAVWTHKSRLGVLRRAFQSTRWFQSICRSSSKGWKISSTLAKSETMEDAHSTLTTDAGKRSRQSISREARWRSRLVTLLCLLEHLSHAMTNGLWRESACGAGSRACATTARSRRGASSRLG